MILALQILAAVIFVLLSGFFSGTETGIYRLSRFRLRIGIEQKRPFFRLLDRAMRDSHSLVFSMLLGTNLSNYIVTSIVTFMFLHAVTAGHTAELYATALVAPVLFVFSELIPKHLYFYRADTLMPSFAPLLWSSDRLFTWTGLVPLLKLISKGFARAASATLTAEAALTHPPGRLISRIIKETREEGFLSPLQMDMMDRLVNISNIRLRQVCVPINKVLCVRLDTDRTALLNKLRQAPFSRLPVYPVRKKTLSNGGPHNIVGFINIYEALTSQEDFTDLTGFLKPIVKLPADTDVIDALKQMRRQNAKIALVTRTGRNHQPRPIGIVTLKDLAEELTGELTEW